MPGTPFNNQMQDMATLEAFINPMPDNIYSTAEWWKKAFEPEDPAATKRLTQEEMETILKQVEEWREKGFLRRTHEVLLESLPKRTDVDIDVMLGEKELSIYRDSESSLTKLFRRLQILSNRMNLHPMTKAAKLRKLIRQILAVCMVCDMELLHSVLSNQGREVTKLFSPTRCNMFENDKHSKLCVVCSGGRLQSSTPKEPVEDNDEHAGDDRDGDVVLSDNDDSDSDSDSDSDGDSDSGGDDGDDYERTLGGYCSPTSW